MKRWLTRTLAFLAACAGHGTPPTLAQPNTTVSVQADLGPNEGQRVLVVGTVTRPDIQRGPGVPWQGTGITLSDGNLIYVSYKPDIPEGWSEFVGKQVRVAGTIWEYAPPTQYQSLMAPHLTDWDTPVLVTNELYALETDR